MTGLPDLSVPRDANPQDFHREQLSAMMDGALSADQTKFLLRRMQHDDALADCWERWQFLGDALRGQAGRALPADFSRRVGRAIADDLDTDLVIQQKTVAAAHGNARRLRWAGGAALVASVALAALIGSRTLPAPDEMVSAAAATAAIGAQTPTPALITPMPTAMPEPPTPFVPDASIAEAGAAAVVAAATTASDPRNQRPRILAAAQAIPASPAALGRTSTKTAAVRGADPVAARTLQVASVADQASAVVAQAEMTVKPWPRALVPGAPVTGEVTTAGFEGSPIFQPFQARPSRLDPMSANAAGPAAESPSSSP
jgi:negative regulator of sigma E activity